jgi:hypothetical protein
MQSLHLNENLFPLCASQLCFKFLTKNLTVLLLFGQAGQLHLVKPYMVAVQSNNVSAVNEALNELYVEEEDYETLHESVDMHDNFDQIGLAQKLKKRRIIMQCRFLLVMI